MTVLHFQRQPLAPRRIGVMAQSPTLEVSLWVLGHLLLALLLTNATIRPVVGTAHALITLGVGLWYAAGNRCERVVYVGAYIVSAEVLWRMTHANVFWEFGKYALAAVFLTAIFRHGLLRGSALPLVYFALLLPSAVLPLANTQTDSLRVYVSFNLSGPFALMAGVWFMSQICLTTEQIHRTFLSLIAPAVTSAALAAYGTLTATDLKFGRESNVMTSGGYGPNQVSALLGLSILAAMLYVLLQKRGWGVKLVLFVVVVGLATQSALTFSRTGLYSAALSLLAAVFYLARDAQARAKLVLLGLGLFLMANYFIFPRLDKFTGGALANRFQNTSLTGRERLLQSDLQIWSQNPVFGVGPGRSTFSRADTYRESASHTEFSRLLAEHGLFGLGALALLVVMAWQHWRRARTAQGKAITLAMLCWSVAFMLSTAMRLAAPSFAFALTAATLLPDFAPSREPEPQPLRERARAGR